MQQTSPKVTAAHILMYFIPLYVGFINFNRGFWHQGSFGILALTFIFFTFLFLLGKIKQAAREKSSVLEALFFICFFELIISVYSVRGFYQLNDIFLQINYFLLIVSIFIILSFKIDTKIFVSFNRFLLLVVVSILIKAFLLFGSPMPTIDVFDSLKLGPLALISGHNPYNWEYSRVYSNQEPYTYFPYPPTSLIMEIPIVTLFKEPRILFIITETLSAIFLYKLLSKVDKQIATLLSAIYLFSPVNFFILEQSWIDPLGSFLLILFAYCQTTKKGGKVLSSLIFTAIMGVKQYFIILPIFFLRKKNYWEKIKLSLIFLFLLIAPFYFANPQKFNIYRSNYTFRYDSLTFPSFLKNNFSVEMTKLHIAVIWIVISLITFAKKIKK